MEWWQKMLEADGEEDVNCSKRLVLLFMILLMIKDEEKWLNVLSHLV